MPRGIWSRMTWREKERSITTFSPRTVACNRTFLEIILINFLIISTCCYLIKLLFEKILFIALFILICIIIFIFSFFKKNKKKFYSNK